MAFTTCLDLSLDHITESDGQFLSIMATITKVGGKAPLLVVYEYDLGYFVSVPDSDDREGLINELRSSWTSGYLIGVIRYAMDRGCHLIQLDRDAARHEGLPAPDRKVATALQRAG
jgi:hypothetical protein